MVTMFPLIEIVPIVYNTFVETSKSMNRHNWDNARCSHARLHHQRGQFPGKDILISLGAAHYPQLAVAPLSAQTRAIRRLYPVRHRTDPGRSAPRPVASP